MSDLDDTTDTTIDPQQQVETPPGGEVAGDNPAWEPIRSAVDETTYQLIKPHLTKFDQDAQRRITSINEKFGWAGKLIEGGMTSAEVEQAAALAQQLADSPVSVFENLKGYVEQYFPDEFSQLDWIVKAAAAGDPNAQAILDEADEGDDPRLAEYDRRMAELDEREARQQELFEQQEAQRLYDGYAAQIDRDYKQIAADRPDLQKEDWKEIMGHAATQAQQGVQMSVADAVAWFDSIANRVRTAPRPGDSAPSLLPLGGGNPGSPQKVDYAKMSDADIQAMIAADMDAKNKQR
jgi:hypothetical protein